MAGPESFVSLSPEHRLFLNEISSFSLNELRPLREELPPGEFIPKAVDSLIDAGLPGLLVDEEHGGCGGDELCMVIALEEMGAVDSGLAGALAFHYLCCIAIAANNAHGLFNPTLMDLSRGNALGALALTEPAAGSNPAEIACSASKRRDIWLINGNKCFVCNVDTVDETYILAMAREIPNQALTCFLIPYPCKGVSPIHRYIYMGWDTIRSWAMVLSDCQVPEHFLVGERGCGLEVLSPAICRGRLAIASGALGLARSCYDLSLAYGRERRQFSMPITYFQSVSFHLADMALRIEACRTTLWKVASSSETPPDKVDMLYLYCGESAEFCASTALEIHGGLGYTMEGPTARLYRDVKGFRLALGTPDITRLCIAGAI
ncbi:MAG: acyl-CoA dehydrogenase family protein [Actinomycetota bacterium]|nr:acyl-CoA dehydrogenase family protein [Actinomycetota bacterium]